MIEPHEPDMDGEKQQENSLEQRLNRYMHEADLSKEDLFAERAIFDPGSAFPLSTQRLHTILLAAESACLSENRNLISTRFTDVLEELKAHYSIATAQARESIEEEDFDAAAEFLAQLRIDFVGDRPYSAPDISSISTIEDFIWAVKQRFYLDNKGSVDQILSEVARSDKGRDPTVTEAIRSTDLLRDPAAGYEFRVIAAHRLKGRGTDWTISTLKKAITESAPELLPEHRRDQEQIVATAAFYALLPNHSRNNVARVLLDFLHRNTAIEWPKELPKEGAS
jgi:hypothetical protein